MNTGTPDAADVSSVRRYLREFLSDPRVVDLPSFPRWLLLNFIILPFRPKRSSKAYQKIWTSEGSPLLTNSLAFKKQLSDKLPENYIVALGMRYGNPSIASAVDALAVAGCQKIIVLPLFPQYAEAATGSAIQKALEKISDLANIPDIVVKRDFYNEPYFLQMTSAHIRQHLQNIKFDLLAFSYHGLPERQLKPSICQQKACDRLKPCPEISEKNAACYRAQCYATSKALTTALGLEDKQTTTCFQSRLGRIPWIKPYTDEALPQWLAQGVKNIALFCPSFVADCLETLEEIGMVLREQWRALGGAEFHLIPSLNAQSAWVDSMADHIVNTLDSLP